MAPKLIVEQKKIFTPQNLTPLRAVQKNFSPPNQKTLKSFHKKVINRGCFLAIIILLILS